MAQYSTPEIVLLLFVGFFLGAVLLSMYRRRELIATELRYRFIVLGSYALTMVIAVKYMEPLKALMLAAIVGLIVANRAAPRRRSRYISRMEKRKAIARYERSGRRYDPRKHEIDHILPHSRGGSSRADNLRVIERDINRAKSAKPPWWDVFSR